MSVMFLVIQSFIQNNKIQFGKTIGLSTKRTKIAQNSRSPLDGKAFFFIMMAKLTNKKTKRISKNVY